MNTENPNHDPAESSADTQAASAAAKHKIAIGSQRDVADSRLAPQKPDAVAKAESAPLGFGESAAAPAPAAAAPEVRSALGLGDNLDAEIEAALSGMSMEAVLGQASGNE
jgi:hypothetical protein